MSSLNVILSVIFLSASMPSALSTPLTAVWLSPIAPVAPLDQYQTQDTRGNYHYAYATPHHTKVETSLNGITQGGYSYIDADGILQTVTYSADPLNGFRVQASNLPRAPEDDSRPTTDTPEVTAAKEMHLEEVKRTEMRDSRPDNAEAPPRILAGIQQPFPGDSRITGTESDNELESSKGEVEDQKREKFAHPFLLAPDETDNVDRYSPVVEANRAAYQYIGPHGYYQSVDQRLHHRFVSGQPQQIRQFSNVQRYVVPVVPYRLMHSSMHHAQDSLGQYEYTYTGDTSAKTESRSLDGTTRGAYSYVDANGLLQQVHYVADHNGFRVAATNLPRAK